MTILHNDTEFSADEPQRSPGTIRGVLLAIVIGIALAAILVAWWSQ